MLRLRCLECSAQFAEERAEETFKNPLMRGRNNLAFKCNWMDTDYEKPCTAMGRRYNIYDAKRPWCSQPHNECCLYEEGELKNIEPFPCYESMIVPQWVFGAGMHHGGVRDGQGIRIKDEMTGKVAVLTTRGPGEGEEDRSIFAYLRIRKQYTDESEITMIEGDPETSLKVPAQFRLRFWDYYSNAKSDAIRWGTGLFRYLSDKEVRAILTAQLEALPTTRYVMERKKVAALVSIYQPARS